MTGSLAFAQFGLGDQTGPVLGDGVKAQQRNIDDTVDGRVRRGQNAHDFPVLDVDIRRPAGHGKAVRRLEVGADSLAGQAGNIASDDRLEFVVREDAAIGDAQLLAGPIVQDLIRRQRIAVVVVSEKARQRADDPVYAR